MNNPLLDTSALPRFGDISPEDALPALRKLIAEHQRKLNDLLRQADRHDFESLIAPLEEMHHELSRVWSPVSHLQTVLDHSGWRDAYNQSLPLMTAHGTEISQNEELHSAMQQLAADLPASAGAAQRRLLEQELRDFRLAGVALPAEDKKTFKALMQDLSAVQAAFDHNVQDTSLHWSWHCEDEHVLDGIPQMQLDRAARDAAEQEKSGWVFSLDFPTYHAVVTYANNRQLREHFYRAWSTRASDQGDDRFDNSQNIEKVLELRHRLARLVGFDNYADYSLATKMADSSESVLEFLNELAAKTIGPARREFADIAALADEPLQPWDLPYYHEVLRKQRFSISDDELRRYFPSKTVLKGLFNLAERLYGIRLVENADVQTWHDDVGFFDVFDAANTQIGGFYTDLYARNGKRGGAWIDECIVRKRLNEHTVLPVGYLVCNFSPLDENGQSLLTHDEVVTTFHEFGHMLHHLLTRMDYPSIAGINGVPWDAVELPSQFMENFAWCYEVLVETSAHCDTGESLPRDVFDKLNSSRHFGAAIAMLRQLEFAIFDFRLHSEYNSDTGIDVMQVLQQVRDDVSLLQHPDYNRMPHSFSHIFAGGYAAGYYSYKWAEVLAADAFSAFEEAGVFDPATASRFREEILEIGGSRDILDAFVAFRGRKPTLDALLKYSGIDRAA